MRSVLSIIGLWLGGLGVAMLFPALADPRHAGSFLASGFITCFFGGVLYFSSGGGTKEIDRRHTYLLTSGVWLAVSFFASIPFILSGQGLTDSVFETVSGLTTTGSTVLIDLDHMSAGLLLWRAILQWFGGVGIIVTSIAILPILQVGGMQLFRSESSDRSEKELPRAAALAHATLWVYLVLTFACALAYWVAGMNGFDAITHSMTTLSTGGYSTHDASMGYFDSPLISWICVVFMLAGGIPFVLYIQILRGKQIASVQVRFLAVYLAVAIAILTLWLISHKDLPAFKALTLATFNLVSIVTTTGYATDDYTKWGALAIVLCLVLTFSGACTGSTSGGLKIMRILIIIKIIKIQMKKLIYPNAVIKEKYERSTVDEDIIKSVSIFSFTYISGIVILSSLLHTFSLDFETSVSGAMTAIANVGPGIGSTIGPAGNFASLPDGAKWLLSFGMLLGRLEFFALLVLLTPAYWRK